MKVLLPVDGSKPALNAAAYVLNLSSQSRSLEVELLNVQIPIASGEIRRFVSQAMIDGYHRAEGEEALRGPRQLFDEGDLSYKATILVGHIGETIATHAAKEHFDSIVMGTRGMGPIKNLVLGSVATQVIHLAEMPVTLVK